MGRLGTLLSVPHRIELTHRPQGISSSENCKSRAGRPHRTIQCTLPHPILAFHCLHQVHSLRQVQRRCPHSPLRLRNLDSRARNPRALLLQGVRCRQKQSRRTNAATQPVNPARLWSSSSRTRTSEWRILRLALRRLNWEQGESREERVRLPFTLPRLHQARITRPSLHQPYYCLLTPGAFPARLPSRA